MDREVLKELVSYNLDNVLPPKKSAHKPRPSLLRAFDPCYESPAKSLQSNQLKSFNTRDENVFNKNSTAYPLINFDKTFQGEAVDFEESKSFHEAMDITYDANEMEQFEDAQLLVDSKAIFPLIQKGDALSLKHHVEGIVDEIIGNIQESSTVLIDQDKTFNGTNNSPKGNTLHILNSTVNWNRMFDCFNNPLGVSSINETFDESPKSPIEPVQIKSDAHKVNDILPLDILPKSVQLNTVTEEEYIPLNTSQVNISPETPICSNEKSPIPEGKPTDLRMKEGDVKFQNVPLNPPEVTISPATPIKPSEASPNKIPEEKQDLQVKEDDVKFQNIPLNLPEVTISPATPIKSSEASQSKIPEEKQDLQTKEDDVKFESIPLNPPEVTISPGTPMKSSEASPNKIPEEKQDLQMKEDDVKFQNIPLNPPEVTISPASPIKSSEASPSKIPEEKQKDLPKEEDSVTLQDVPRNLPEVTISSATPINSSEASPNNIPEGKPKDLQTKDDVKFQNVPLNPPEVTISPATPIKSSDALPNKIPEEKQKDLRKEEDSVTLQNVSVNPPEVRISSGTPIKSSEASPNKIPEEKLQDHPTEEEQSAPNISSATKFLQALSSSKIVEKKPKPEDNLTQQQSFDDMPIKRNKPEEEISTKVIAIDEQSIKGIDDVSPKNLNSALVVDEVPIRNTQEDIVTSQDVSPNPPEVAISLATPIKSSEASPNNIPEEKPKDFQTKEDEFRNVPPNPPQVTTSPVTPMKSSEASPSIFPEEKQKDLPKEEDNVTLQGIPANPPEVTISPAAPMKSSEASPIKIPEENFVSPKALNSALVVDEVPIKNTKEDMVSRNVLSAKSKKTEEVCRKDLNLVHCELKPMQEKIVYVTDPKLIKKVKVYKHINEDLQNTLATYESQLKLQIDETVKCKEEYNMMQKHFTTLEMAFADVHQKYERSKIVLEGYRANEKVLKERLIELESKVMERNKDCNELKETLNEKVKACTNLLKSESDKMQSEVNKYVSIIKRMEIKVNSLTSSLEQKTKECTDLAKLLDELT